MSVTGPARASLTAQLQERLTREREQIEALTESELRKLAASLQSASRDALEAMRDDTDKRLALMRNQMERIERRQRLWPLWTALGCAMIAGALFGSLWVATGWKRSELRFLLGETVRAERTLRALEARTGGVVIQASPEGTFVILPDGADPNWNCGESDCLKLPE